MKSMASSRLVEISSLIMPSLKPCAGSGSPAATLARAPAAAAPLKRSRRVSCIAAVPLRVYLRDKRGGAKGIHREALKLGQRRIFATRRRRFGYGAHKTAELHLFFQPARPDQFVVPDRDIGTAVAHAHGAITEDVRRLNDGDRLKMQSTEQVQRIPYDGAEIFPCDCPQAAVERRQQEHRLGVPLHGRFGIRQICALAEMVERLRQFHELGPGISEDCLLGSDASGEQPFESVRFFAAI